MSKHKLATPIDLSYKCILCGQGVTLLDEISKGFKFAEQECPATKPIGFKACWKEDPENPEAHCRKPQEHDGECAFY